MRGNTLKVEGAHSNPARKAADRALSALYRENIGRLRAYLTRILKSQADAEDVAQESFLRLCNCHNLERFRQLRAYGGAPLPLPIQRVSARAWADEAHVDENRALYQEKFRIADAIFAPVQAYQGPEGGFFLWLPVEDGEAAALKLWRETGVRVLPGAYLAREVGGHNPGKGYIRVAMVAPKEDMQRALLALRDCIYVQGR